MLVEEDDDGRRTGEEEEEKASFLAVILARLAAKKKLRQAQFVEVCEAVSMSPQPRKRPLHVAGLILARGGSEGIPLKNLAPLGDKPLLEWALGAMLNFGGFDSLWVSTDHAAIATCATSLGSLVFARSPRFATSTSPSIEAVNEFLHSHPEVDVVALVQCTSPFLRPGKKDINPKQGLLVPCIIFSKDKESGQQRVVVAEFLAEAYRLMVEENYDSVFSVCRSKRFRWSEKSKSNSSTSALNFDPSARPRRQEWTGDLVENGMFYFAKRDLLLSTGRLQGGRKCTYVEVDAKLSLEIDSSLDLALAQQIILHEGIHPFLPTVTADSGSITMMQHQEPTVPIPNC